MHMKTPVPESLFKKETLAQVFSCEFCEILKNTSPYTTPQVAASMFSVILGFSSRDIGVVRR